MSQFHNYISPQQHLVENMAAADLSSAGIIFGATLLHLPVSTTHVISSAIMEVRTAQRIHGVTWRLAQKIIWTCIISLRISAALAAIVYRILALFF